MPVSSTACLVLRLSATLSNAPPLRKTSMTPSLPIVTTQPLKSNFQFTNYPQSRSSQSQRTRPPNSSTTPKIMLSRSQWRTRCWSHGSVQSQIQGRRATPPTRLSSSDKTSSPEMHTISDNLPERTAALPQSSNAACLSETAHYSSFRYVSAYSEQQHPKQTHQQRRSAGE